MHQTPDYLKEFRQRYKGFLKRSRSLIIGGTWHLRKNRGKFKENTDGFKHENQSTLQVVEGLSTFIEGAEGLRQNKAIQKYINEMVDIINIHLDRVDNYYTKNDPDKWTHLNKKKQEEIFQQVIFKGENEVRQKLNKLNVSNNFDNLQVTFHSGKVASLPYKKVLEEFSLDIKEKIKGLDIDWDLIIDNGFFINIPKTKVPTYNPRKHFFDQDKDVLQFYVSEWNKMTRGYEIDGYYIHPWLYFHLNFFHIAMPMKNERGVIKEEIVNPLFRRNEWYFTEILKKAEQENRGAIFMFGSRRIAKSVLEASYLLFKTITSPNSETNLTVSNEEDRQSIMSKIDIGVKYMHPFLSLNFNRQDWDSILEVGLKTNNNEKIRHCDLRVTNTASGSKKASQKGAGGAPVGYVYDESGKNDFLEGWEATKFSFKTPEGWKAIPLFSGTGSNVDISSDAEKVLNNPTRYDFLEGDWDLLEYKIPKEAITWKRRTFAFFMPGQMSYEEGMKSIKMKFSKFVDVESEKLDKVTFYETDWIHNSKTLKETEARLKREDKKLYQSQCVFLPTDPEHCFMSAKSNPFPASVAKTHRDRLMADGDETLGKAIPITLHRDSKGEIYSQISDKEIPKFPFQGGNIDAPILLYGELPDEPPPANTFFLGLDDYKHLKSDGESIGVAVMYKRDLSLSKDDGKIVAILATRPDPHIYFHQQIHLLLEKYNAVCFPENEDMGIKTYFDRLGLSYKYLAEGFDVNKKFNFHNTGNRKYGWQPNKVTTPFMYSLVVEYCKRQFEIKDEDGNVIEIKLGVELIDDIYLLDEIIKFREGGNYDRIVAFGSALMYDHYMTMSKRFPRREMTEEEKEKMRENILRPRNRLFSTKRRRLL